MMLKNGGLRTCSSECSEAEIPIPDEPFERKHVGGKRDLRQYVSCSDRGRDYRYAAVAVTAAATAKHLAVRGNADILAGVKNMGGRNGFT